MSLKNKTLVAAVASLSLACAPLVANAVEVENSEKTNTHSEIKFVSAHVPAEYFTSESLTDPTSVKAEQENAVVEVEDPNAQLAMIELPESPSIADVSWDSEADAPDAVSYRVPEDENWGTWHELRTDAQLGGTAPIILANASALEVAVQQDTNMGLSLTVVDPNSGETLENAFNIEADSADIVPQSSEIVTELDQQMVTVTRSSRRARRMVI